MKILIVDDEEQIRSAMNVLLLSIGHECIEAATGPEALRLAVTESPHLIVLDLRLPGMDGFQVLTALRQNSVTSQIPVMMLSGVLDAATRLRALELGADQYLTKPFDPFVFRFQVEELLRRWR